MRYRLVAPRRCCDEAGSSKVSAPQESEGTMGHMGWSKWELIRARNTAEKYGWIEVTRYPTAKREPILYRLTWMKTDKWDGKPKLDPGAHQQKVRKLK